MTDDTLLELSRLQREGLARAEKAAREKQLGEEWQEKRDVYGTKRED